MRSLARHTYSLRQHMLRIGISRATSFPGVNTVAILFTDFSVGTACGEPAYEVGLRRATMTNVATVYEANRRPRRSGLLTFNFFPFPYSMNRYYLSFVHSLHINSAVTCLLLVLNSSSRSGSLGLSRHSFLCVLRALVLYTIPPASHFPPYLDKFAR